jgi:hypothetical protein
MKKMDKTGSWLTLRYYQKKVVLKKIMKNAIAVGHFNVTHSFHYGSKNLIPSPKNKQTSWDSNQWHISVHSPRDISSIVWKVNFQLARVMRWWILRMGLKFIKYGVRIYSACQMLVICKSPNSFQSTSNSSCIFFASFYYFTKLRTACLCQLRY